MTLLPMRPEPRPVENGEGAPWRLVATSWAGWPAAAPASDALVGAELGALDQTLADSMGLRFLVLIENPARMVAARLAAGDATPVDSLLKDWHLAAHRLLRLLRLHRESCTALYGDDALAAPAAVCALLVGAGLPAPLADAIGRPTELDPITISLGRAAVEALPWVARLDAELRISCERIEGVDAAVFGDELPSAFARLRDLLASEQQARALRDALDQAHQQLDENTLRLRDAQRERNRLTAMTTELDDTLVKVDELAAERRHLEAVLTQSAGDLRSARSELAALDGRLQASQASADRLVAERDRLRGELTGLDRHLQASQASADRLVTERDGLRGELATSRESALALAQRIDAERETTRRERIKLDESLLGLRSALAEVEARRQELSVRVADLASIDMRFALSRSGYPPDGMRLVPSFAGTAGGVVRALGGRVRGVEVGAEHGDKVHLGIDLRLSGVEIGERRMASVPMRLVDHRGHLGLLLFADEGGSTPLAQWEPNGQEGERPFVLAIPDDPAHQSLIARLGSSDWGLVMLAASAAEQCLAAYAADTADARWAHRAAQLRRQLERLPRRLRYDNLRPAGTDAQPEVRFVRPLWGAQAWDEAVVALAGSGPAASLHLVGQKSPDAPLLLAWPRDATGEPATRVSLYGWLEPAAWRAHPEEDRRLVEAVLDSLQSDGPEHHPRMARFAADLRRRSVALRRRARLRRLIASLFGRIPETQV